VLKRDRPFVEPDPTVVKNIERQKQIRHHAHRLRQLGADEGAIVGIMERLLAEQPVTAAPDQSEAPATADPTCQLSRKCSRQKASRPSARGALGFRLRDHHKNLYSVVKEPSGTTFTTPPPKTTKRGGSPRKKPGANRSVDCGRVAKHEALFLNGTHNR
jgi:hypothetical protein